MSSFEQQMESWVGRAVLGPEDEPLGALRNVFLEEGTGRPTWALLDSPERATDPPFVPFAALSENGEALRLSTRREQVLASPRVSARDARLSPGEEEELARHYAGADAAPTEVHQPVETVEIGSAGELPAMVRSQEEFRISKTAVPRERVRLIKRVVTETVTRTFEVRREELEIERLPVEPQLDGVAGEGLAPPSGSGRHFVDSEEEIVLMEEEVVVTKRVVPRERVRLVTRTVVEDRQVSGELAREEVELEQTELPRR